MLPWRWRRCAEACPMERALFAARALILEAADGGADQPAPRLARARVSRILLKIRTDNRHCNFIPVVAAIWSIAPS